MATTNFGFELFESNAAVDLIGVYNAAMTKLDTELKTIQDMANGAGTSAGEAATAAQEAKEAAQAAQSTASSAQSTAQAAQSAASTAQSTAESAQSTASAAQTAASEAQSAVQPIKKGDSDEIFTVSDLAGAKVTSGGYVYFDE